MNDIYSKKIINFFKQYVKINVPDESIGDFLIQEAAYILIKEKVFTADELKRQCFTDCSVILPDWVFAHEKNINSRSGVNNESPNNK